MPRAYQRTRDENFNVEGLIGTQLCGRTFGIIGLGKNEPGSCSESIWAKSSNLNEN